MREISCEAVEKSAFALCKKAVSMLAPDTAMLIECAWDQEISPAGQGAINDLTDNFIQAGISGKPLCPLAGAVLLHIGLGEGLADSEAAIQAAAMAGASAGLAAAGLSTPGPEVMLRRLPGDRLTLCLRILPCRAEQSPWIKTFPPGTSPEEMVNDIVGAAAESLPYLCAPIFAGVGLADNGEEAARLALEALCRPMERRSGEPELERLEKKLLIALNKLGVGPMGYGERKTALAVNAQGALSQGQTLYCALSLSCHSCRVARATL